ncbi:MAG: T9SS type A sorting domain-containing protein [Bacteroidota bacterium]|nr:T9SS type A sorting domain-containing protein [Bacteroidota bacterium]
MIKTMHHLTLARHILATLLAGMACTLSVAQYGDFGLAEQPADTAAVDDIIYYGDYMDMSGGYNVGDTVFDFTAYDFDGNPINLYDQLAGEQPVVLVSGSVSCIRFRNVFDPLVPGQEVWAARTFIYDHQDDFNWIFIYGVEAHPTDGNCPSNCPPTINTDTAVVQPAVYSERRWAMHDWENSTEHDMPFTMYADNPDNSIYNNFFQRPFGLLALNCDGTVGIRADWVTSFFLDISNGEELMMFRQGYTSCQIDWEPEEDEEEQDDTEDDTEDDDTTGGDDDSDDDEPVDYHGPDHALEGHTGNGTASDLSEQAPTGAALRVFPNPAQSLLTVVSDARINSLQLTDLRGRTVAQWTAVDRILTLPVADLPRGQYVLIGRTPDGAISHRRVILH